MEKVQNLKHCTWISEEISIADFKKQHDDTLRATFKCHPSKVGWQEACKSFFSNNIPISLEEDAVACDPGESTRTMIEKLSDPEQMEKDCGINLLTVPNELPPSDVLDDSSAIEARMPNNWFEGSFNDAVIPEGSGDRLLTLFHQSVELNKRLSVGDYATLRYRTLKYFTTLRLPQKMNTAPLVTDFPEDVILNIRIQRPYFKRLHMRKASDKFPAHAQELLLRGHQSLTSLRDAIECVNDFAVPHNFANDPDLESACQHPRAKEQFPSGLFYINGTFYVDKRNPNSKDYSVSLLKWAKKISEIGELKTKLMEETTFGELQLRLGYPYLYLHQGSCEHLITFTDIRLQERTDLPDLSSYPVTRGHSSKLSVRCCTCNRNLAAWVVVGCFLLNAPNAHLCHSCLKLFCYDAKGQPKDNFSLYPFYDEGTMQVEKLRLARRERELLGEEDHDSVSDTPRKKMKREEDEQVKGVDEALEGMSETAVAFDYGDLNEENEDFMEDIGNFF